MVSPQSVGKGAQIPENDQNEAQVVRGGRAIKKRVRFTDQVSRTEETSLHRPGVVISTEFQPFISSDMGHQPALNSERSRNTGGEALEN